MLVKVAQMFEDGGLPLPRNRAVTHLPVHVGKLSMCDQHDKQFRRCACTAYSRTTESRTDVIPTPRPAVSPQRRRADRWRQSRPAAPCRP